MIREGYLLVLNAVWALRLRWRAPGVVLWGGRVAFDYQLGSAADRRRARRQRAQAEQRRMNAGLAQAALVLHDHMTPVIRRVNEQLAALGRQMAEADRARRLT